MALTIRQTIVYNISSVHKKWRRKRQKSEPGTSSKMLKYPPNRYRNKGGPTIPFGDFLHNFLYIFWVRQKLAINFWVFFFFFSISPIFALENLLDSRVGEQNKTAKQSLLAQPWWSRVCGRVILSFVVLQKLLAENRLTKQPCMDRTYQVYSCLACVKPTDQEPTEYVVLVLFFYAYFEGESLVDTIWHVPPDNWLCGKKTTSLSRKEQGPANSKGVPIFCRRQNYA